MEAHTLSTRRFCETAQRERSHIVVPALRLEAGGWGIPVCVSSMGVLHGSKWNRAESQGRKFSYTRNLKLSA